LDISILAAALAVAVTRTHPDRILDYRRVKESIPPPLLFGVS
jgi:hypothetical protein